MDDLRDCCEGAIPAVLSTCALDGTPNVTYLSQVEYIDERHLALSFQFFNTTRRNILENPLACLWLIHPVTVELYRIRLRYLRTETAGALFERMRAKLAGIASHEGMAGVFKLQGSDVYVIEEFEVVPGTPLPRPPRPPSRLAALRASLDRIAGASDLATLFDGVLDSLRGEFGIEHSMLLMLDESGRKLYTVASRGYPASGIGAEIPLGAGVIGTSAASRSPIRIGHATNDYRYGRAIREAAQQSGFGERLETAIPFPGLLQPRSQLAVPITPSGSSQTVAGVLCVESLDDMRFSYDDEDALVILASQVALQMRSLQVVESASEEAVPADSAPAVRGGPTLTIRHFRENHSIFLDDSYLIKGVAGAIFWALVSDYVNTGRSQFSNRELRLDARIGLPDLSDNLEARLILLQRRLTEHRAGVQLEKTARGRFSLAVAQPLQLIEA